MRESAQQIPTRAPRLSNRDSSGDQAGDAPVHYPPVRRRAAQSLLALAKPALQRLLLPGVISCMLTGCSFMQAPSFELFGAYFPAWMLCGLIGIVGAAATRIIVTTPVANEIVPLPFAVCTAAGVIAALLTWMVLFR